MRTQLHSEAIAAMNGGNVEEGIINDLYDANMDAQNTVWVKGMRLMASYQFVWHQGMPFFLRLVGLAPAVWNVPESYEDKLASVSEVSYRVANVVQMSIGVLMLMLASRTAGHQAGCASRVRLGSNTGLCSVGCRGALLARAHIKS